MEDDDEDEVTGDSRDDERSGTRYNVRLSTLCPFYRVLTCPWLTVRLVPRHLRHWRHVRRDAAYRLVCSTSFSPRSYALIHAPQERGQARLEPEP